MAPSSRRNTGSLSERLEHEATRFEFLQVVRLLRRFAPDRAGVGRDADPEREVVQFRSDVTLAFPTADVTRLEPPVRADGPPRLTVSFLGVATPASYGSLPVNYAHEILEQERDKSSVLRDFFDAFNHRLISLYYRAFEKYHLAVCYEAGESGSFENALRAVLGVLTPGLRERLSFSDRALFARSGLLAMAPVSAPVLESLVQSYFRLPARVEQFLAAWYPLAPEDQLRLGKANACLGVDAVVGSSVRLTQFRFRLRVGPLRFRDFEELLPTGSAHEPLFDLVRLATAVEQSFDLQLVLLAKEVPPLELAQSPAQRCRLGWSTWLGSAAPSHDAADAVFSSESCATHRPAGGRPALATHPVAMENAA
ncbi:MAG TPA: type VI secretion system baseplate subunit TssG [Myxococcota bacterium]|nr:type VI secretion system baseplate subunit TssG [Myxococcota bacterium]